MNKLQFIECVKVVKSINRNRYDYYDESNHIVPADLDFVSYDEDGADIVGPDGQIGWFNCGSSDSAFSHIEPSVVREFRRIYIMCHDVLTGDITSMNDVENIFNLSE